MENTQDNVTHAGMEEIDLKQILDILASKLWLIIILPILFSAVGAYLSYYVMDPVYETSTTLYINEKKEGSQIAYNDLMVGTQLVKDYRVLIKSRMFTRKVIEELNLENMSTKQLANNVTVNAVNDTRLIEIKAQSAEPVQAKNIANKLAEVFTEKITEIIQIENITIVDSAPLPGNPVKPNPLLNIAIAFTLGIMAGIGTVFFIEYFDDKIRTVEDAEKIGLSVLGTVPEFEMEWEGPES